MPLPALIGAGVSLLGSAIDAFGQHQANQANARMAQQQMEFQERMSNTSYQRAVADIRAAGLNPALAYGQGGANSPTGSTAAMQNVMGGMKNSAAAAAQTFNEIRGQQLNQELTAAQIDKTRVETAVEKVVGRQEEIRRDQMYQDYNINTFNLPERQAEIRLRFKRDYGYERPGQSEFDLSNPGSLFELDRNIMQSQARNNNANAQMVEYGLPGARNEAWLNNTRYGRYLRPILNDAGTVLGAARAIRGLKSPGASEERTLYEYDNKGRVIGHTRTREEK